MSVPVEKIAAALGGGRLLGRSVRTTRDLDALVRRGIPRSSLDYLIGRLVGPEQRRDFAARLRHKIVPRATYQRARRLNIRVSETTERLARLYALALSVFVDVDDTRRFMMSPHPELENRTPFDVALTEIGGREVEEVIERGLHGLPG
jgi:putative toxin-antitoxin system antitoxin component (TIGR02293 family)